MGTIVSFHAHPDDESIACGVTLARAAAAGHRGVVVFATRGVLGEPVPGVLAEGEELTVRRSAEVYESAAALGAQRVEFLGYVDSGMMGEPANDAPYCFWQTDVEHAARRLALILAEEQPDVLTVYDDNGAYGHPDHIQVHRVGMRAAELAGVPIVAQSTINRDLVERLIGEQASDPDLPDGTIPPEIDPSTFGKPEAEITHEVDGVEFATVKRASMAAHASQLGPDHFMLAMPDAMFVRAFGVECYIVDPAPGADAPALFTEIFTPMR